MMKILILPYAAWMGVLSLVTPLGVASDVPRIIATAGVLGSLTVLIYRLGVWRQEMENTKTNVGETLARIERRLDATDHVLTDYMDSKPKARRWRRQTERRLERLEERQP
jgi:hypothetical protein